MRVEFCTSVASGPLEFVEGRVIDLTGPLEEPWISWLRSGIVKPIKDLESEVALEPAAVEHAIARRSRRSPRGRKRVKAVAAADECP